MLVNEVINEAFYRGSRGVLGFDKSNSFLYDIAELVSKYPHIKKDLMASLEEFQKVKSEDGQAPYISPRRDKGHSGGTLKAWKHAHVLPANKLEVGSKPVVLYYDIDNGILRMWRLLIHTPGTTAGEKQAAQKLRNIDGGWGDTIEPTLSDTPDNDSNHDEWGWLDDLAKEYGWELHNPNRLSDKDWEEIQKTLSQHDFDRLMADLTW